VRQLALIASLLFIACAPLNAHPASALPSETPRIATAPEGQPEPSPVESQPPVGPPPVKGPPSVEIPMPAVSLKSNTYSVSTAPALRRVTVTPELQNWIGSSGLIELMYWLDNTRGGGPYARVNPSVPVSDEEWNSRIWPGPFQKVAKAVASARPAAGRFFHLDAWRIDAAYALPWAPTTPSTPEAIATAIQFIDVTVEFRDHAETPPAEGELWYTWHLRFPSAGLRLFSIADGYDGVTARTWMNVGTPYWSRALLDEEATSAVAGYLWNESYAPGGRQQYANGRWTTPFWTKRIADLNRLNELFDARRLTERRFENMTVRIDGFEPMTFFGGGVVTVTISGRVVEVLDGKTIAETFSQPMKFFRFGGNGNMISGWAAVDSQEDGVWLSGGDLALSALFTSFG